MLSIDIYSDYDVEIHNKGAYISQEDSTPTDITFTHYDDKHKMYTDGGRLLDFIAKKLQEYDISEMIIKDNKIVFEFFNPNNGEGSTQSLMIRRVEKDEEI